MGTPTRGRKVPWDKNTEILERLPKVEELRNLGLRPTEIAKRLGVGVTTIKADLKRLQNIYRQLLSKTVEECRGEELSRWEFLYSLAMRDFMRVEAMHAANREAINDPTRASGLPLPYPGLRPEDGRGWLETAMGCQMAVAKLTGTLAPIRVSADVKFSTPEERVLEVIRLFKMRWPGVERLEEVETELLFSEVVEETEDEPVD
jgi:hypothetical protein